MTPTTLRPKNALYMCFTETSEELARVLFFNRYAREPAELYREGQYLYVGPVVVEVEAVAPMAKVQENEQPQMSGVVVQMGLF